MTVPSNEQRLTPRQQERRRRILDVARKLTAEQGYEAVSMRTIAAKSGVAEKTLYNIFVTKDRLIATAAQERALGVLEMALERSPEGGWATLFAFAACVDESTQDAPTMARVLAPVLLDHPDLVGLEEVYEHRLSDTIAQLAAAGSISCPSPRLQARLLRIAIVAAVLFWARYELRDEELGPYLELCVGQLFLPIAHSDHATMLAARIAVARTRLESLSN